MVKIFKRCRRQRLSIFGPVTNSDVGDVAMSATALKSSKRRFSSIKILNFWPTHTGLICVKTLEPIISSLGPFKESPLSS